MTSSKPGPSWLTRALLSLYPPTFRRRHGEEIARLLELERHERRAAANPAHSLRHVADMVADALWAAAGLWLSELGDLRRILPSSSGTTRSRSAKGDGIMRDSLSDLRFSFRGLRQSPGFSALAILTLALGVGAVTTISSVVYGVLLAPLPYEEPGSLVQLFHRSVERPTDDRSSVSFGNFADWREQNHSFSSMAAGFTQNGSLTSPGEPDRVVIAASLGSPFEVLGVPPIAGRTYTSDEDRPDAPPVVVVGERLAEQRFGSISAAVGQTLILNGRARTVIGVMPDEFDYPAPEVELWLPSRFGEEMRQDRTEYWLEVVARLAPTVSLEDARGEMETIAARLRAEYPQANDDVAVAVVPLLEVLVGDVRSRLSLLQAAVVFVLLIACANLAHLLLARGDRRRSELVVREALGASRARLVRELSGEGVLIALAGGALGVLLAALLLRTLLVFVPEDLPRLGEVHLSPPVIALAFVASAASCLLFGVLPALTTTRRQRVAALRDGRGAASGLMGGGLMIAEVALAVVLLVGAGLLSRSFFLLQEVDPGFRTERILTFNLAPSPTEDEDGEALFRFYGQLEERLAALPGVSSVALVSSLPGAGRGMGAWLNIKDQPLAPDETPPVAVYRVASESYFGTVGIPLLAGRMTTERDGAAGTPSVVINETARKTFWPNTDPIGKVITLGPGGGWIPESTVVGVVGDVAQRGLGADPLPVVYMPHALAPAWTDMGVVLRAEIEPTMLAPSVRQVVRDLDPSLPIFGLGTMESLFARSIAPARSLFVLQAVFASAALLLAAIGVFGTLSYSVSRRRREMGIRLALGAAGRSVVAMVMVQGLTRIVAGLMIGLVLAAGLGRLMSSVLYGVTPLDPWTYLAVSAVLLSVGAIAVYLPAHSASRVEPVTVLQSE